MNDTVEGLNQIKGWSGEFSSASLSVAGYITAVMLSVSLIFIVQALATKRDNVRTCLIARFVALIFVIVFILQQ